MKKVIKKTVLLLFAALLVFVMSGCGRKEAAAEYDKTMADKVTRNVLALMQQSVNPGMAEQIAKADEEELSSLEKEISSMGLNIKGAAFQSGYASYHDAVQGDLGEIVSIADSSDTSFDGDTITSHIVVTGTKTFPEGNPRTATVEILMSKRGTVTSVTYNVDRTFGEKIVNAGLNTVLGMGTTFCLLIFISIVIWLMGTIVQNVGKKSSKDAGRSAADKAVSQIAAREEQEARVSADPGAGDGALIAVIAAAIAAYESEERGYNVSPDTFIVRSLRRR